ncbi:MAG: hypothetical protein SFU99_14670 [Saprospiraceae bacterium]|nr:hypothetical protein [Saprospiraceae bacterium]
MSIQTIYQTYLQHLSMQERLELIRLLVDETIAQPQDTTPLHSVMEFAGAGKPYALEEDAQVHINQLRSEWD